MCASLSLSEGPGSRPGSPAIRAFERTQKLIREEAGSHLPSREGSPSHGVQLPITVHYFLWRSWRAPYLLASAPVWKNMYDGEYQPCCENHLLPSPRRHIISANVRNNNNIREAVSGKNREIEGGQREGGRE